MRERAKSWVLSLLLLAVLLFVWHLASLPKAGSPPRATDRSTRS